VLPFNGVTCDAAYVDRARHERLYVDDELQRMIRRRRNKGGYGLSDASERSAVTDLHRARRAGACLPAAMNMRAQQWLAT
jgi:hypothetical protein